MQVNKNIPNLLSGYRLLAFPVLLFLVYTEHETAFAWFICINLFSDILDGLIARKFNLQTVFGAKLDSAADITTMIAAMYGIVAFKWPEISPYFIIFLVFAGLYVLSMLLGAIKFGQLPSLHLYSFKIMGYLQGLFIFVLFSFGFNAYFFMISLGWGILACLEEITVLLILKKMKSNAKGLYWILQKPHTP